MPFNVRPRLTTILGSMTALAFAAGICQSASADVVAPDLEFYLQVNEDAPIEFYPTGVPTGGDTWNWQGTYDDPNWSMVYNINGDTDPMLNSFVAFQNNTNQINLYTITVALPVAAIPGATLMDGSVGGSVTDANGDGFAQAATVLGSSIYQGQIDGADRPAATLLPFPYAATVGTSGGTTAIGPTSFGQPVPVPGPGVLATIGIRLQFTLTPGDSIALTSFFRVVPVPAPGGLALLGLAGLSARRRRRA